MQEKNKIIKKLFSREKAGNRSSKKIEKPWVMQYKWVSEEAYHKHSWFSSYNLEWQNHYDKYMDTDHAIAMLNKELRGYFAEKKYEGRELRLLNKQTGEVVLLGIQDKKIIITP